MKMNDSGFPDFIEVKSKFNLGQESELREYIEFMYRTYNNLYKATLGMSPEKIKFLNNLGCILSSMYFDEINNYCHEATQGYSKIQNLFVNEPDKHAVVQRLFEIYIDECAENFKQEMVRLFQEGK